VIGQTEGMDCFLLGLYEGCGHVGGEGLIFGRGGGSPRYCTLCL
jgi:hypothetical protein